MGLGVSDRRNDIFYARERNAPSTKCVSLTAAKLLEIEIWKYLQPSAESIDLMRRLVTGHAGQTQRAALLWSKEGY